LILKYKKYKKSKINKYKIIDVRDYDKIEVSSNSEVILYDKQDRLCIVKEIIDTLRGFTFNEYNNTFSRLAINDKSILVIKTKGNVWFRASDTLEILEYSQDSKIIRRNITKNHKIEFIDMISEGRSISTGVENSQKRIENMIGTNNLKIIEKLLPNNNNKFSNLLSAKFIDIPGLITLLTRSKMPLALEFQKWFSEDVMSSLITTGTYILKDDFQKEYVKNEILSNNRPVIYISYIGTYDYPTYKYGKSDNFNQRENTHDRTFKCFKLSKLLECVNSTNAENKLHYYLVDNDLRINMKIDDDNIQTEIFEIRNKDIQLEDIIKYISQVCNDQFADT
jgi:prophage antirepressor-like protein